MMNVAVPAIAAAAFGLLPFMAFAEARVERNVVYGMYSGTALLLDVHYPATPNGYGIVFVPGSGWSSEPEYDAVGLKNRGEIPVWVGRGPSFDSAVRVRLTKKNPLRAIASTRGAKRLVPTPVC